MFRFKYRGMVCALALVGALGLGGFTVHADRHDNDSKEGRDNDSKGRRDDDDRRIKTVFVIAMENHNWTQPSTVTAAQQIFQNPAAPFINSLVNGTSGISGQVSYANGYINAAPGDHPSEPNYIWAEAGTNFGVNNDDDPYHLGPPCTPDTVQTTPLHLTAYLMKAKESWKSYQEDTDVDTNNIPLPQSAWTVPLSSLSGNYTSPGVNEYNFSTQINYAAKHNPMIYFTDTNGGCNTTNTNPLRLNYAPLQQLALDLQSDSVARYNWITPNQYNDQHSTLATNYGTLTGDAARIAQGDNFVSRIVPLIMASKAYKDHGAILLWWDESEGGDTSAETIPFIVISKEAHENVSGKPYSNTITYSHSSFVRTMQEIFGVDPWKGYNWLGDASNATDLSDLFKPDVIE